MSISGINPAQRAGQLTSVDLRLEGPQSSKGSFTESVREAFEQVNADHGAAQQTVRDLLSGRGIDVHTALLAVEKADLSFQLMLQVRNKMVQAYQEISRLQF